MQYCRSLRSAQPVDAGHTRSPSPYGKGGKKPTENRGHPKASLRPIVQCMIHSAKFCGSAGNQAHVHVRSQGMAIRRGNDYCRSAFDTHHPGKIKHHHVTRIKQCPPPGNASPRIATRPRSGLLDPVRSRGRFAPQRSPQTGSIVKLSSCPASDVH